MPETRNWLQRTLTRETTPGISARDGVTRFGTFFHKPGDSRWRNAGRIARAVGIGLVSGPGGVFGAAARSAAQGEAREGLSHAARSIFNRGPRVRGGVSGGVGSGSGAEGEGISVSGGAEAGVGAGVEAGPPPGGGQRPSLNTFALMREAPGAAAWAQGLAMQHKPRNVEK